MARTQNSINSTFVERTITITTGSLADEAVETGTVEIARLSQIKKVVADRYSETRLYGTAAARTADASRDFGDFSFLGTQSQFWLGVLLNAATGLTWFMSPPALAQNCEVPTSATIYYSIRNLSGSTSTVTITLKVIILEA